MNWYSQYPPKIAGLLARERLPALGPGTPDEAVRPILESLTPAAAFAPRRVRNADLAAACLAGLWLRFDFLDESHHISQENGSAEGSFWHAIMHRREPDSSNSKYWFRKVGSHPVLKQLVEQAPSLGYKFTDPFAFVDLVECVRGTDSTDEETARKVQQREWELLFAWCFHGATPE